MKLSQGSAAKVNGKNSNVDKLLFYLNKKGIERFKHILPVISTGQLPAYSLDLVELDFEKLFENLERLLPFMKGVALSLVAPQKRRALVEYVNSIILSYIKHNEIDHSIAIISELTANAEKSNFESVIASSGLGEETSVVDLLRKRKDEVIDLATSLNKRVDIIWKYTPKIFKVEIKNNTIISDASLTSVRDKMSDELTCIADGFSNSGVDTLGAGLGLYFVNFFSDEIKDKYGFDTIFRIYNTEKKTSASLTIFFETVPGVQA